MSKTLKRADIINLARLARLRLDEAEVDHYQKELNRIFSYIDQLESVDTRDLEPTLQITGLTNVMREDVLDTQEVTPENLMRGVPCVEDGYIKVRRMI